MLQGCDGVTNATIDVLVGDAEDGQAMEVSRSVEDWDVWKKTKDDGRMTKELRGIDAKGGGPLARPFAHSLASLVNSEVF